MIEEKEIIEYLEVDNGFNKKDIETLLDIIKFLKLNDWEDIDYLVVGFTAGKESMKEKKNET